MPMNLVLVILAGTRSLRLREEEGLDDEVFLLPDNSLPGMHSICDENAMFSSARNLGLDLYPYPLALSEKVVADDKSWGAVIYSNTDLDLYRMMLRKGKFASIAGILERTVPVPETDYEIIRRVALSKRASA